MIKGDFMYVIFKSNRPAGNTRFSSYEAARQALRKRLRKLTFTRVSGQPAIPFHLFGYEIRNVA